MDCACATADVGAEAVGSGEDVNHGVEAEGLLGGGAGLLERVFAIVGGCEAGEGDVVAIETVCGLEAEVLADVFASEDLKGRAVLWLVEGDGGLIAIDVGGSIARQRRDPGCATGKPLSTTEWNQRGDQEKNFEHFTILRGILLVVATNHTEALHKD